MENLMSQWIITPDKFLTDGETRILRKSCEEAAIIAKSKGNQLTGHKWTKPDNIGHNGAFSTPGFTDFQNVAPSCN